MKFFSLLMVCALVFALTLSGCGKKVGVKPAPAQVPITTAGFGSVSGTCSVCKKKSDNLLAMTIGDLTATVCSSDCGGKFRTNPNYYGVVAKP